MAHAQSRGRFEPLIGNPSDGLSQSASGLKVCASSLIRPDGTLVYPESVLALEAEHKRHPNDEAIRARLSMALLDFAYTVNQDRCVDRKASMNAALTAAKRAVELNPENFEAIRMVEILILVMRVSEEIDKQPQRPRPLPELAIPIPRATVLKPVVIPRLPLLEVETALEPQRRHN